MYQDDRGEWHCDADYQDKNQPSQVGFTIVFWLLLILDVVGIVGILCLIVAWCLL